MIGAFGACFSYTRTALCDPVPLALADQLPLLRLYSAAAVHGLYHVSSAIEESDLYRFLSKHLFRLHRICVAHRWGLLLLTFLWSVGRSVCLSVGLCGCNVEVPCKNGWTDRDAVWHVGWGGPQSPCIKWGSGSPMVRGHFGGFPPH